MMSSEFKKIIGKKILDVKNNCIYLEDGLCIEYHPYETYIGTYSNENKLKEEDKNEHKQITQC